MDSKKPETSEMIDLSEEEKYSEDISNEKSKQSPQKLTSTRKSEEQRLPSEISSKSSLPSAHTSTSSSKDPVHKIKLDETPSSKEIFISSRLLRSRTNCSRNLDAIISPRKNLAVSFSSEFLNSDTSDSSNVSRKSLSSLGEERDSHVLSPSERVAGRVTRSLSKVLAEANTPSPEKRSAEVLTPTPTKKIRKGPERRSGRFRSKQESCKSKLSPSKVVRKSPTDVQTQEKRSSKMVEKSESLTTTALVIKRKRKTIISSSEESETAIDLYELRSPFSVINAAHKSPSNVQTQESKLDVEDVGEPCIKITKAQEQSLISSKDTQLSSNKLDSPSETLTLGPSQISPLILNPHAFVSPSKTADSGIETKTFEPCQTSPKILNPQSLPSCHSPKTSDSIIYTPRRALKYETPDGKSEIDANLLIVCTLKSPTSETTTSGGMLRGSSSDETLTSRHGQYGEFHSVIESASLDRSRSLSEMAKELDPQFQKFLPRYAPTDTSPIRNLPASRTQSNQVIVEMTGNLCNELSTATSDQEVQMQGGSKDFFLQRRVRSISDNVFTSGNRQTRINAPNTDVSEVDLSISKDEGCNMFPQRHVRSISDNVSKLANPSAKSNIYPPDVVKKSVLKLDLYEMISSASSCQPVTTDDYGTSSDDQLDSASDVPLTKEVRPRGAIDQFAPSGDECFPAHDAEARHHLHSVMKSMLLHIKEDDQVKEIESLLAHLSPSSSKEDVRDLYIYLITYSGSRKKDLWVKSMSRDTTPEAYLGETYEKLLTMVIETFASTLSVRSCSDFDEIILHYQNFKTFNDIFSGYWENNNIDDVEDEGCRENLKNLKQKMERYMMGVQSAFQHFLAYVGEKADQKSLAIYEDKLSESDKKFLREC